MNNTLLIKKMIGLLNEVKNFNNTSKDFGEEGELIAYITEYFDSNEEIEVLINIFKRLEDRRKFASIEREHNKTKKDFLKLK